MPLRAAKNSPQLKETRMKSATACGVVEGHLKFYLEEQLIAVFAPGKWAYFGMKSRSIKAT